MTGLKLYEIADLRDLLDVKLAETEGELTPEIEAEMEALHLAADEKIERVALWIREQTSTAEAIESEAKRLQARAAAKLNAARSLKGYLEREMARLGKTKVNGLLATVAMQRNGPSVVGDLTPDHLKTLYETDAQFVRFVPASYALDRKAVLAAHKAEQPIPEGLTVVQTESLRIR
jgi:hypothetical protein